MSIISSILELLNKMWPSRKAQLVKKLDELTAEYQKALLEGRDTDASLLKKQIEQLRKQAGFSEGDV